jgi:hypothetical protein
MVGFGGGVRGFWNSTANLNAHGVIYGLTLQCEKALICMRTHGETFVYPAPALAPEKDALRWEKIWVEEWHFTPEHKPAPLNDYILRGNRMLVRELVRAAESGAEPPASIHDALLVTEIIQGAYVSHLSGGGRVRLPLAERGRHPLA